MHKHTEWIAWVALALILIGLPAAVLGYQFFLRPALAKARTIDIVAAAPEAGGFQPENIRVAAGETVRLRFFVPDVTHGIAIGPGLDIDLGHIDPGQVKEIEVTFDEPGRYTLYCNTWCSPNHWRMRSIIEVYDPANPDEWIVGAVSDPVIESLLARDVDIDASHEASVVPSGQPSAKRGAEIVEALGITLPSELTQLAWRRSHSPVEAWTTLVDRGLYENDAWDVVAYLWFQDSDHDQLQPAATLYAKNCAACHGETGNGQGPGAAVLVAQNTSQHSEMAMGQTPTVFTDPQVMLGGSSDIYYAKLRRGGMGTGMPSFGPVFTPEETWSLVDYLWTFVFEVEMQNQQP
jgi:plastocyanin/mono/diheme cytochrome c family protein